MKKSITVSCILVFSLIISIDSLRSADKPVEIKLPAPQTTGGMSLKDALSKRKTRRRFSTKKLSLQLLSDLLWAARGVNRKDSGMLTVPTAHNWKVVDIYVALEEGLYLFDSATHNLKPVLAKDLRALTGIQAFAASAPVNLIYVADYSRVERSYGKDEFFAAADTGHMSQNVYLFCASEGLATVIRGMFKKGALAEAMGLNKKQAVILCQTVGYPGGVNLQP